MPLEGSTPLNKPPIDLHTIWAKNKLAFLPHVTLFCKFAFDILEASFLNFDQRHIFSYIFSQNFLLGAGEQRPLCFQPVKTAFFRFRPRIDFKSLFSIWNQESPFLVVLNINN